MRRNIKKIINEQDAPLEIPKLPEGHRAEFFEKLTKKNTVTSKKEIHFSWKSIAAACVLLFGMSAFIYTTYSKKTKNESPLLVEMKAIESEYLTHIASEWKSFQLTANDEYLVYKYKERLQSLDLAYQELKQEFLIQQNSLTVLNKMIQNLQLRLTLLQEIQQHLKRLQDEQQNM